VGGVAKASCLIRRFMQKIYSHIGQILVEVGLVVGFIFGVLVALILIGTFGSDKIRRWFGER
jgi:hypothetical protein